MNDPEKPTDKPAAPASPGPARSVPPPSKRPPLVVPGHSPREIAIAVSVALVVLGIIAWGTTLMFREQGKPSANQLTGVIVAKHDKGEREELVSVGRKGLKTAEGDSGYWFDVRVDDPAPSRTYEVPVNKAQWDAKKVGDKQTFIRPVSEQR